jgi:hypothetical protein
MNPLLQRLGKLSHLQCAVNGHWEECIRLHSTEVPPSESAIRSWIGQSADFALEMSFTGIGGLPQFVGVRWLDKTARQVTDIVHRAHRALQAARSEAAVSEVLSAFEDALDIRLLRSAPTFLELGVNNLWKSVGSLVIWQSGQSVPSRNQLIYEITGRSPRLLLDHQNAIMLEVGCASPQPHWLGLCASRQVGALYRMEVDAILSIALQVCEKGG